MTAKLYSIDGGAKDGPNLEFAERLELAAKRVRSGEVVGGLMVLETPDGDPEIEANSPDALALACVVELMAGELKRSVLGL